MTVKMENFPIDLALAQVRLQLQNIANKHAGMPMHQYRGSIGTIRTIIREEGRAAPFKVWLLTLLPPVQCRERLPLGVHVKLKG